MSGFDVDADGAEIARVGKRVVAEEVPLTEGVRVVAENTLFLERPEGRYARLNVITIRGEEWVLAFSTMNRLVKVSGPCRWMALLGGDLMENMPPGVSLGIDIQDEHAFFVPTELIAARAFTLNGGVQQ